MRISDWSSDVCSSDLFVQSEEGSVWLNNLLTAVKEGDRKALGSIVAAVLAFFAMGPALHLQEDFGAWLLAQMRSEEHTSELPSLMRISYAVFCLNQKKLN